MSSAILRLPSKAALLLSVILGLSTKLWLSTVVQSEPSLCLKVTLETGNFTISRISENVGWFMPDCTFPKINIWYAINTQTLDMDCVCETSGNAKNLHIVVKFWPSKVLTTTYCVICNSEDGSCLCLKVLSWDEKARSQWMTSARSARWARNSNQETIEKRCGV